jgi:hypothetical protein
MLTDFKRRTQMANDKPDKNENLHIFVNRRKFEQGDGVKAAMTGAEIAALVEVPRDNAVVRRENDKSEIAVDDTVPIKNGDHFLVTRKVVEGGCA